jgi:CRISPR-associated protein Csm4
MISKQIGDKMTVFKVILQLKSRLVTPLMGDTIFGHILWGIARNLGDEAVAEFINNLEQNPLVVSNAFPHDYLPKPLLIDTSYKEEDYANIKKIKKIKYVPAAPFFKNEKITTTLFAKCINDEKMYKYETIERLKNTCDRIKGGTLEETGLYGIDEIWVTAGENKKVLFDVYIGTSLEKDDLEQYIKWAFENGYGADASVGAGVISLSKIEPVQFPENGKRAMTLGSFVVPDLTLYESLELRANTTVKRGKVGDIFTHQINPFKKPILFYSEGATFNAQAIEKPYIGSLLRDVHKDNRIVHQGWALTIRFNEG